MGAEENPERKLAYAIKTQKQEYNAKTNYQIIQDFKK